MIVELDVSRTVLREATKVLAAKGLVESRPRIGTKVRPRNRWRLMNTDVLAWQAESGMDKVFFHNLAEMRYVIEPAATRLAAVALSAEETG